MQNARPRISREAGRANPRFPPKGGAASPRPDGKARGAAQASPIA